MMRCVLAFLTAAAALSLLGCNTMEGLGKDVQKLGNKIEKKADQKKFQ
jgi:predicted small secreted protein